MIVDKNSTTRLFHPNEDGNWVDVVLLTGSELDLAEEKSTVRVLDKFAKHMSTLNSIEGSVEMTPERDLQRRKARYNPETLIEMAVKAWSLELPVTPENLAKIDSTTRDWLWTEIVVMNTRPLVSRKD